MSKAGSFLAGMLSGGDLKSNLNNWNERAQHEALNQIAINTGIIADRLYISNSIACAQPEFEFSEQTENFQERWSMKQEEMNTRRNNLSRMSGHRFS